MELSGITCESVMRKNCKISNDQRRLIIELVCDHNKTHQEVSKLLQMRKGTVSSVIRIYKKFNRVNKLVGRGRKPLLTPKQKEEIICFANNNRISSRKVKEYLLTNPELNFKGQTVSLSTIERILKGNKVNLNSTEEKDSYSSEEKLEVSYVVDNVLLNEEEGIEKCDFVKNNCLTNIKKVHRQLTNDERRLVIELVCKHNKTHREVSKLLRIKKGTVSSVMRVYRKENRVAKRSIWKKKTLLSEVHESEIRKFVKKHKNVTLKQVKHFICNSPEFDLQNQTISLATLHRLLQNFTENVETETGNNDLQVVKKQNNKLTNDQRRIIIELITQHGKTQNEVAELLLVKKGTVSSVMRVFKRENRVEKRKCTGKKFRLNGEQEMAILGFIKNNKNLTLKCMLQKLAVDPEVGLQGKDLSLASLQRLLHRKKVTLKSLRAIPNILNNEQVKNDRFEFANQLSSSLDHSQRLFTSIFVE